MPEPNGEFRSCAVCGRHVLRGERVTEYLTPERERAPVCALCKPRAETSGWVPAAMAGELAAVGGARRRSRLNLRERLAARAQSRSEQPAEPEPDPAPRPRRPAEVFNSSHEARKVAGLTRSLGEPRVCVRATATGHRITVAWDLSWYQWSVSGEEVRQMAKGNEISELDAVDREWNATAAVDGSLELG